VKPRNGIHEILQIEATLARLELCEGVAGHTVRHLALHSRMLRVPRGETLVRRGEQPTGVFAVVHGSLKTRLQPGSGDELILALLGAGSVVGVAASVLDQPSRFDLVALEESLLLATAPGALWAEMARDPRLARNVASHLATKAHLLMTEFEHSRLPALRRLAAYLQSVAEPAGEPHVWRARLPVTKTALAARLGMKKETLSRLLRSLASRGLIAVSQREITILDRRALEEASSDRARGA
jgi:CRP-like cAMP-binding protein